MKAKRVGQARIDSIFEHQSAGRSVFDWFPDATSALVDRHRGWMAPTYMEPETDHLVIVHQSYLIRLPGLTVLVDTCIGEDKDRPGLLAFHRQKMPMVRNLRAAGIKPEDIDLVLCTHLHVDHIGWNTKLENGRWVPTFANARYLFGQAEFDYWQDQHDKVGWMAGGFEDSVLPIIEAGKADLVAADHQIGDGLRLEPMPGHTPGLVCLNLESDGEQAAFCGDVMHHPLQVPEPQLSSLFCADPAQSAVTRRSFIERHADTPTLILPTHFAGQSVGHIVSDVDGYCFAFAP